MTGKFIAIEGMDGAGKTSQAKLLVDALRWDGLDVIHTREPGGTVAGEALRETFLNHEWDGTAEAFILMAIRRDHVANLIKPALAAGKWVVCERFSLTTLAYQGYGRGVNLEFLWDMDTVATGRYLGDRRRLLPDLSIVLNLPVSISLSRIKQRGTADRMERLDDAFFEKVRTGFLEMAAKHRSQCDVIDATGYPEEVHSRVLPKVHLRLGTSAGGDSP